MKPPVLGDAYARYMGHVTTAMNRGFPIKQIIEELKKEKETLMPRGMMKAATLAMDPNPYKKREVVRAAHECATAIERIIGELQEAATCEKPVI